MERKRYKKMSKIKDYLYELEMEEMTMRAYEEGLGIELYDYVEEDSVPDEVWEPEYLGDR